MALLNQMDFSDLINDSERLVVDELNRQIEKWPDKTICACRECLLDMAAFALNCVRPHYRVSLMGAIFNKSDKQKLDDFTLEVKTAVTRAVEKISANPGH